MGYKASLAPGVTAYSYVSDPRHRILASDATNIAGPNIGENGENLTITCLSLNRSELTLRLIHSIAAQVPYFAGEILIVDNGSTPEELQALYDGCAQLKLNWRVCELDRNYGVAGGRNRAFAQARKDWVFCLDNDIYFLANPLPKIQNDIAVLGCHFLNVPLLDPDHQTIFSFGGHLHVGIGIGALHVGASSALAQGPAEDRIGDPFLSTFLLGGACVCKRSTFERLGGYDDHMFIGFEDIDFSIRLFQEGYKVGVTGHVVLVHDHPAPQNDTDHAYERQRFSRQMIHDSARYMEKKHGFDVWNDGVEGWIARRHEQLGIVSDALPVASRRLGAVSSGKPRIALVIDTDNWAFGNIARQLKLHLSHRFDIKIIPSDVLEHVDHIFMAAEKCDLVHFFWREYYRIIDSQWCRDHVERMGVPFDVFDKRFVRNKPVTTSVYDHLYLSPEEIAERAAFFKDRVTAYTVSSKRLEGIYQGLDDFPPPSIVTHDGVDLERFGPANLDRFGEIGNRPLVIGWAGNSKWASELQDAKGFNSILIPVIEQLRTEGYRIETRFADRQKGLIPHEEMPAFYGALDLYVCPSLFEGTPNPILEAMACGVPVVTHDVGVVREVFGPIQSEFIVTSRTVDAFAGKIRALLEHPETLRRLSAENLERIQAWNWAETTKAYEKFFDDVLAKHTAQ
ncbi:glycosyltransferase [Achromobacter sp. NPDC058515]|uniref:glycosyltransferase n=1 Tax=Achromobacter sp. NPDC058515 TaxID=3346533 RepID=UPI003646D400